MYISKGKTIFFIYVWDIVAEILPSLFQSQQLAWSFLMCYLINIDL